jgi:hypothetical protein
MPAEHRLHVLEARVSERFGCTTHAFEVPYDELPPAQVQPILDELVKRGADFPVVLVGHEIACADGIDLDAVLGLIEMRGGGRIA